MLKLISSLFLLLISSSSFALEYAGQYVAKERPKSCTLGVIGLCHENEYVKILVILERRKIKLLDYKTNNYDVYAVFKDETTNKVYKQKSCPSIIKNIGKSYHVTYDPYQKSYYIGCKNFK